MHILHLETLGCSGGGRATAHPSCCITHSMELLQTWELPTFAPLFNPASSPPFPHSTCLVCAGPPSLTRCPSSHQKPPNVPQLARSLLTCSPYLPRPRRRRVHLLSQAGGLPLRLHLAHLPHVWAAAGLHGHRAVRGLRAAALHPHLRRRAAAVHRPGCAGEAVVSCMMVGCLAGCWAALRAIGRAPLASPMHSSLLCGVCCRIHVLDTSAVPCAFGQVDARAASS
jgi:hypothetical protein